MRYSHFSPSELELCHQLQEVCLSRRPMSCVVIPGIGNSFVECEGGALQRETRKGQETMSISTLVEKVSVRDLPKITGRLSYTVMTVLPAPIQQRRLQQQQITGFSMRGSYKDTIVLHKEAKMDLDWRVQNQNLNNGQYILPTTAEIVIQSDASKLGWGAVY